MRPLRIFIWACALVVAINAVAFASGFAAGAWFMQLDESRIPAAAEAATWMRRGAIFVMLAGASFAFARGLGQRVLAQVLLLWAAILLLDAALSLALFRPPWEELIDPWAALRYLVAMLLGYALARRAPAERVAPAG